MQSLSDKDLRFGILQADATAQEVRDLAAMYKVFRPAASEAAVRSMLANKSDNQILMLARAPNGAIAGALTLLIEQTPYDHANVLHLEKAVVAPAWRGQQLFRQLYENVAYDYAQAHHCDKTILIADPGLVPYYNDMIGAMPNKLVSMQANLAPQIEAMQASGKKGEEGLSVAPLGPEVSDADCDRLVALYKDYRQQVTPESVRTMLETSQDFQITLGARQTDGSLVGVMTLLVERTPYEDANTLHLEKRAIASGSDAARVWQALWKETLSVAAAQKATKAVFVCPRYQVSIYRDKFGAQPDPQISLLAPHPRAVSMPSGSRPATLLQTRP